MLSVITPTLNRAHTLRRALDSVRCQPVGEIEHIVVDGGSDDGTLELLRLYPEVRVWSGNDLNLYDAINRGIQMAHGDVIGHLNSDDCFLPGALGQVQDAFANDPSLEMVSGGAEVVRERASGERHLIIRYNTDRIKQLREYDIVCGVPIINARFFRKTVYDRIGLYDIRFPLASDREFMMRAHLAGLRNRILPDVVYQYYSHAESLTFAGPTQRARLAEANLDVARRRFRESRDQTQAAPALRRWLAWTTGYRAALLVAEGKLGAALSLASDSLSDDPAWMLRFARALLTHAVERGVRCGPLGGVRR